MVNSIQDMKKSTEPSAFPYLHTLGPSPTLSSDDFRTSVKTTTMSSWLLLEPPIEPYQDPTVRPEPAGLEAPPKPPSRFPTLLSPEPARYTTKTTNNPLWLSLEPPIKPMEEPIKSSAPGGYEPQRGSLSQPLPKPNPAPLEALRLRNVRTQHLL